MSVAASFAAIREKLESSEKCNRRIRFAMLISCSQVTGIVEMDISSSFVVHALWEIKQLLCILSFGIDFSWSAGLFSRTAGAFLLRRKLFKINH